MAATFHISSLVNCNFKRVVPGKPKNVTEACTKLAVNSVAPAKESDRPLPIIRRSGNYMPSIWDNNFLQSMTTDYMNESYRGRAHKLKEEVELMYYSVVEPLRQIELVDHLQRLGLDYYYHAEIERTLRKIYNDLANFTAKWGKDLHATALAFRILRQHGFHMSPEVFKCFWENGSFKDCVSEDVKGLVSLYEASYFSIEGESLMEEAWSFTNRILRERVGDINDLNLDMQVRHALELPIQWRIPRLETRWYIDMYEKSSDMIPSLLEFAKLDFNIVQALHQEELKDLSTWWTGTGLGEKLGFARDRMVASYFWGYGVTWEPQNQYCRVETAKVIELITVVDDVYDVYGTLDELEVFTHVIDRWDINAMQELPDYMKMCFLAIYNHVNVIVYDILKEQNVNILPHLKKIWVDLAKAYLAESRWYHSGYKPTLDEYLNNGLVSIAGPYIVLFSYLLSANPIKKEELEFLEDLPDILRLASEVFRLSDDYGTSIDELKRGDIPKSIQCYMSDTGVSQEVARKHMMVLMRKKWTQVNKFRFSDTVPLSRSFVEIMLNLNRTSHCFYNIDGVDGHGIEEGFTKDRLLPLVVKPIPL